VGIDLALKDNTLYLFDAVRHSVEDFISPKPNNCPPIAADHAIDLNVSADIALNLFYPVVVVALDIAPFAFPVFPVPELPVAENRDFVFGYGYVWRPRQLGVVFPIPDACAPKSLAQSQLNRSIFTFYAAHCTAALTIVSCGPTFHNYIIALSFQVP